MIKIFAYTFCQTAIIYIIHINLLFVKMTFLPFENLFFGYSPGCWNLFLILIRQIFSESKQSSQTGRCIFPIVPQQIAFKENGAIKTDFMLKEKQCLNVFKR
ncbi:hypothetical protein BACCOP_02228 [Phocaeicola coprocola DSM 17136]|uniref:Uncharacterized protein n=1 Tax=Phocaeicola coprocola DSM 17136 TaxID=470145 RepID=B3JK04_9BACT|nr:hypothetical protein BACCOP_02228 [Phocaeicola coprocola DSM 17136]